MVATRAAPADSMSARGPPKVRAAESKLSRRFTMTRKIRFHEPRREWRAASLQLSESLVPGRTLKDRVESGN